MGTGTHRDGSGREPRAGRRGRRAPVPRSCRRLLLVWAVLAGCGPGVVLEPVPRTAP